MSKYSKSKILIMGSNSFLANALIDSLNMPEEIIGVYNENNFFLNNQIRQVHTSQVMHIGKSEINTVYIISAHIPTVERLLDRNKLYETNVKLIGDICQQFNDSKIVFCSSVSVYGENSGIINELSATTAKSEYGISKLWGECIVQNCASYSIMRISSMYGMGMKKTSIIPHMITNALTKKEVNVFGEGERYQNYIHVSDVANYLISAAKCKQNGIFLATTASSVTNKELANIIANYTNATVKYIGTDNSPSYHYDNRYTNSILKYQPKTQLETGIKELIQCQ